MEPGPPFGPCVLSSETMTNLYRRHCADHGHADRSHGEDECDCGCATNRTGRILGPFSEDLDRMCAWVRAHSRLSRILFCLMDLAVFVSRRFGDEEGRIAVWRRDEHVSRILCGVHDPLREPDYLPNAPASVIAQFARRAGFPDVDTCIPNDTIVFFGDLDGKEVIRAFHSAFEVGGNGKDNSQGRGGVPCTPRKASAGERVSASSPPRTPQKKEKGAS